MSYLRWNLRSLHRQSTARQGKSPSPSFRCRSSPCPHPAQARGCNVPWASARSLVAMLHLPGPLGSARISDASAHILEGAAEHRNPNANGSAPPNDKSTRSSHLPQTGKEIGAPSIRRINAAPGVSDVLGRSPTQQRGRRPDRTNPFLGSLSLRVGESETLNAGTDGSGSEAVPVFFAFSLPALGLEPSDCLTAVYSARTELAMNILWTVCVRLSPQLRREVDPGLGACKSRLKSPRPVRRPLAWPPRRPSCASDPCGRPSRSAPPSWPSSSHHPLGALRNSRIIDWLHVDPRSWRSSASVTALQCNGQPIITGTIWLGLSMTGKRFALSKRLECTNPFLVAGSLEHARLQMTDGRKRPRHVAGAERCA